MSAETIRLAREVRQAQRLAERANRRVLVRALRADGLDARAILHQLRASRWRVGLSTVRADIRALEGPQPRRGGWTPAAGAQGRATRTRRIDARRRVVRELLRQGLSPSQIATRLHLEGLSVHLETVRRDVRALRGGG